MSDQDARLINYFLHADRFLFGLKNLGQRELYAWLETKGFVDKDGRRYRKGYEDVARDMVENQGIKMIIGLVIDQINKNFDKPSLEFLSKKWHENELPVYGDLKNITFKSHKYGGCSFLETSIINCETHVDGWSNFAKMFFVELENLTWQSDMPNTLDVKSETAPASSPEDVAKVTQRVLDVLGKLPYDAHDDKNKQMVEKILVLVSLSELPETKPIYDRLSKMLDFGRMMAIVTIGEGNSQIGEAKNE